MKYSKKNLGVIENFILHLTHAGCKHDEMFNVGQTFTAKELYRIAKEYIDEDHVDGEDNLEDHIVTYGAESSFIHEDKEKKYIENIVVVADFGEEIGTETILTIEGIYNLKLINKLLKFTKNPWEYKRKGIN